MNEADWLMENNEPEKLVEFLLRRPMQAAGTDYPNPLHPGRRKLLLLYINGWLHGLYSLGFSLDFIVSNANTAYEFIDGGNQLPTLRDGYNVDFVFCGKTAEELAYLFAAEGPASKRRQKCEIIKDMIVHPWSVVAIKYQHVVVHSRPPTAKTKTIELDSSWLTPAVRNLALQAYNTPITRRACNNSGGKRCSSPGCGQCYGHGVYISNTVDKQLIDVLADALEEAGCPGPIYCPQCKGRGYVDGYMCGRCAGTPHPGLLVRANAILAHLRSGCDHYHGCWALDVILGHERI